MGDSATVTLTSKVLELDDSIDAINEFLHERGWTDGHPVIPPTEERVSAFLSKTKRNPADVIATLEPGRGDASIEKMAIAAVMAGCKPEYMPVLVAAVEAITDERSRLYQTQTTSHSASYFLMVNGPIRHALDFNSGMEGSVKSWRANASIARALRLLMLNVGGVPGSSDMHCFGWLVKYIYAMPENEEASPWEPYHVENGFKSQESTVTAFALEPPHHLEPMQSSSAAALLGGFADSLSTAGCRNAMGDAYPVMAFCPDHAKAIAAGGFSKSDVKRFFFEHARIPLYRFDSKHVEIFEEEWKKFYTYSRHARVPMVARPEDFRIIVMGGAGPNSLFMPGLYRIPHVTRRIDSNPLQS